MRNGYILLHRQGLTQEEWKHPLRTLAWIDLCTMAAWEDFAADDGVQINRGEVIASYGFLATRWRVSKDTAHCWIKHWIAERQVERRAERCTERSAERFFLLNYAKYQDSAERVTERPAERTTERSAEQMKVKEESKTVEKKQLKPSERKGPHPGVQAIMDAMKEIYGQLDDSDSNNRRYAWLLLKKADMKAGPCIELARAAKDHDFWGSKVTKVEHLYRNAHRIANDLRGDKSKVVFIS